LLQAGKLQLNFFFMSEYFELEVEAEEIEEDLELAGGIVFSRDESLNQPIHTLKFERLWDEVWGKEGSRNIRGSSGISMQDCGRHSSEALSQKNLS